MIPTAYPVMSLSSWGGLHTTSRLSSPTRRVTRTSRGRPSSPPDTAGRVGRLGRVWVSGMPPPLLPLQAEEEALVLWRGRKGVTGGMGGRLRGLETGEWSKWIRTLNAADSRLALTNLHH